MRPGKIALTPSLITFLSVLAFLAVLNFAITPTNSTNANESTNNTNLVNGNADLKNVNANNTNDDRTVVTNTNTAAEVTKDWKTYENTELGYSLKYPPTWKDSTCGFGWVWFGTEDVPCGTDAPVSNIMVGRFDAGATLEASIETERRDVIDPQQTELTVSGIPAVRITGTTKKDENTLYGGGLFRDYVLFPHNDRVYRIGYFTTTGEKIHEEIFLDFLYTFTFILTAPTAGWQMYTNTALGFSVKIPPSWQGFSVTQQGETVYITHPDTETVSFAVSRSTESESIGASLVGTRDGKNYFFAASNGAVASGYDEDWNLITIIRTTFQLN